MGCAQRATRPRAAWPAGLPAAGSGSIPCLGLAARALADGRALPVVLNAANEVAVAAFLERRLRFTGIAEVIERAMDEFERASPDVKSLGQIRHLDHQARGRAWELARSES